MFSLGSLVAAPREGLTETQLGSLARALNEADAVVVGAGAGLSTAAGLTYDGPRFEAIFGDFIEKYRFQDMYPGASARLAPSRSAGRTGAATSGATAT